MPSGVYVRSKALLTKLNQATQNISAAAVTMKAALTVMTMLMPNNKQVGGCTVGECRSQSIDLYKALEGLPLDKVVKDCLTTEALQARYEAV